MNRLRGLNRRIQRATGRKKRLLEREYDLTYRSLGRLIWVSAPPLLSLGEEFGGRVKPTMKIDGTFKRRQP